jgi:hypothetical protein
MPKARFIAYEGFGHAFHWEDPGQFTRDLLPFLTSPTASCSIPIGYRPSIVVRRSATEVESGTEDSV